MALNVGDLVAYLRADDTKLASGLASAKSKLDSFGESAKAGLKAAGAVAGVAVGGAIASGVAANLDIGEGRAKLAAQLNLSKEDSARLGEVAGKVYANNWGDNLDQINDAMRSVGQNIGDVSTMSSGELQKVTESALALSSTFDVDLATATEAAGKLIKNGLAKDSTEAFDIMTAGFQNGVDRSGDFLDTLNEYSPQFKKLGIDGEQATAILSAGLKAGARDTDTIADAFKEFSLRSIDGSKSTADAFHAIGMSADYFGQEIAAGGDRANRATQAVLKQLNSIQDPVKQNAIGVALFGTQWEDTLRVILPAIASAGTEIEGLDGATQRMADTAGSSGKAKIDTMKRSVEQWVQSQTAADSVLGTTTAGLIEFGGPAIAAGGQVGALASGLAAMHPQAALAAAKTGALAVQSGALKAASFAGTLAKGAVSMASLGAQALISGVRIAAVRGAMLAARAGALLWAGAQWLLNAALNANPISLIIIAVVALVAAIVIAWKNSETFRTIVIASWNAIKAAAIAVFGWLRDAIPAAWNAIKDATSAVWNAITGAVVGAWNGIKAAAMAVWGAIVTAVTLYVTTLQTVVTTVWSAIQAASSAVWNAIKTVIDSVWSGIKTAVTLYINAVRTVITTAWNAIKAVTSAIWSAIKFVVATEINGIKTVIAGISAVVTTIRNAFTNAKNAVVSVTGSMISYVSGIPGRITGALGNLGSLLYNAGRGVIQGLVNGIMAMASAPYNAVSGIVNKVRSLLPGSPVKEGPLRILNDGHSGKQIVGMVADGITDGAPRLHEAMSGALAGIKAPSVSASVGAGRTAGIAGAAEGRPIVLRFVGNDGLVDLMRKTVQVEGGGNVQAAFGRV